MDLVQGEPLMEPLPLSIPSTAGTASTDDTGSALVTAPMLPLPRTTYATASSSYTNTSTTRRRQRHRSDDPVDRDGRLAVVDRGGRQG